MLKSSWMRKSARLRKCVNRSNSAKHGSQLQSTSTKHSLIMNLDTCVTDCGSRSVSYTHLDVYKRQVVYCGRSCHTFSRILKIILCLIIIFSVYNRHNSAEIRGNHSVVSRVFVELGQWSSRGRYRLLRGMTLLPSQSPPPPPGMYSTCLLYTSRCV